MSRSAIGPNAPEVLKQISLRVAPGKTIGIVGPSGSGKSTLPSWSSASIMPEEGQVLLDGIDLSQVDPAWLRSHIGVVLQDNLLFNRTIRDNIALANPAHAARARHGGREARRRRRIHRQACPRLRHDDRGARRQSVRRPAPAHRHRPGAGDQPADPDLRRGDQRARLRERTGHPANMRQIVQGRTVFIIAHRLAAVRDCDVIIGMIDGRIVEAGTHSRTAEKPAGALRAPVGDAERRRRRHERGQRTPLPRPLQAPTRQLARFAADREFLPADLEILETPPSPVRMALILIICSLVVVALAWACFGRIDIVAVAQGKIQPTGRVKVIQPLEAGKVAAIKVENGQQVKAGQVLLEMEHGDSGAEEANAQASYDAYRAEALRRRAAIDAAQQRLLSHAPQISWGADIPELTQLRENQVLAGDLAQLADVVADYDAQIRQKEIERDRFSETMTAQAKLVATLQERVDMRSSLVKSGSGAKSAVIDAEESLQYHQTQLAQQKGQRDAAVANLDVLARERDKAYSNFIADNAQKLAEAQRQADDWRERLVKAKLKSARMSLASPIDGAVYGLSVTTIGQVVGAGDELMRIVPEGAALEIECYLANKDVGFVKPGQKAVVKIESFPFTRYGALAGDSRAGRQRRHPAARGGSGRGRFRASAARQDLRGSAAYAKFGVSGDVSRPPARQWTSTARPFR